MCAAQKETTQDKVSGYKDYKSFVDSLGNGENKLFILSITHGSPVDEVLKSLGPLLKKGDIILDGGNEWCLSSEARKKELREKGVSQQGEFPSGDDHVLEKVMPILENLAAKYNGKPCVAKVGPGGSGHYVKMVHNGIEQGMLSVLNESWELLFKCLHTGLDEISWILTSGTPKASL